MIDQPRNVASKALPPVSHGLPPNTVHRSTPPWMQKQSPDKGDIVQNHKPTIGPRTSGRPSNRFERSPRTPWPTADPRGPFGAKKNRRQSPANHTNQAPPPFPIPEPPHPPNGPPDVPPAMPRCREAAGGSGGRSPSVPWVGVGLWPPQRMNEPNGQRRGRRSAHQNTPEPP